MADVYGKLSAVSLVSVKGDMITGKNWVVPEEKKEELIRILTEFLGDPASDSMVDSEAIKEDPVIVMPNPKLG